ncbi:MAG: methylmalonyl-CoA epimerase [Gemmatimonadetes bacterium]|nr:methylmalonyl-CoA epimerase [Gemmatimonadota bacterium]
MDQLPLDHVAVAVRSIAESLPIFELLVGARSSDRERVVDQGVDVVFVGDGDARIELIEPLSPDSGVGRFIDRRGPGLHHIAFRVPDLATTLERLAARGVELIDREPRPGAHGRRVAFVHPRSTAGVLVELVEG